MACPECQASLPKDFVRGVFDRILQLAPGPSLSPAHRPPYRMQVPLNQQPGLCKSRLDQLVAAFGSEMAVLHQATPAQLVPLVGPVSLLLAVAASGLNGQNFAFVG